MLHETFKSLTHKPRVRRVEHHVVDALNQVTNPHLRFQRFCARVEGVQVALDRPRPVEMGERTQIRHGFVEIIHILHATGPVPLNNEPSSRCNEQGHGGCGRGKVMLGRIASHV